jgi:hypothetical protein
MQTKKAKAKQERLENKNITWMEIDVPLYRGDNPYKDLPMIFNHYNREYFVIKVNLATGIIQNWHYKENVRLFLKVVDNGIYRLYDENNNLVEVHRGYVPNKLLPPVDGYGDYLELYISPDGKITNWYEKISFEDFYNCDDFDNE